MRRAALRTGVLSFAAVLSAGSASAVVLALRGALDGGARTVGLAVAVGLLVLAGHVLLALRSRVDVAEQLAERRRDEALTAAAGVRQLVAGLVTAEEGTRGQLAAELHDTVAQSLALARQVLADGLRTADDLARLSDHVEDAEEQLRAVLARTRPPALRDGDLAAAVAVLRADCRARYGLETDVTWPAAAVPLPLTTAVTVYRFFSEALVNVVKHADVDAAQLSLEVLPDEILATVWDGGAGFEPELVRPDAGRHVGLLLLGERARLCGGRLDVLSGGGHVGTLVRLRLPRPVAPVRIPAQRAPVGESAGLLSRAG